MSKSGFFWDGREQILADFRAEIQKKKRIPGRVGQRSIHNLNEVIESQRGEIYRAAHQGDEQLRRDQQLLQKQLSEQSRDLREAHEKSQ